jgi:hypothetical protein
LHLLMPARVPHLRFGKDADLVHLFSQVVGLDDREEIAELAGKAAAAISREATRVEHGELASAQARIAEGATRLAEQAPEAARALPSFAPVCSASRTQEDVQAFGQGLTELIDRNAAQLAQDLGIDLPGGGPPEDARLREGLDNLPGHVQLAADELGKDLAMLFPGSLGLRVPDERLEAQADSNAATSSSEGSLPLQATT